MEQESNADWLILGVAFNFAFVIFSQLSIFANAVDGHLMRGTGSFCKEMSNFSMIERKRRHYRSVSSFCRLGIYIQLALNSLDMGLKENKIIERKYSEVMKI